MESEPVIEAEVVETKRGRGGQPWSPTQYAKYNASIARRRAERKVAEGATPVSSTRNFRAVTNPRWLNKAVEKEAAPRLPLTL